MCTKLKTTDTFFKEKMVLTMGPLHLIPIHRKSSQPCLLWNSEFKTIKKSLLKFEWSGSKIRTENDYDFFNIQ